MPMLQAPQQAARRWKRELDLAGKRERNWRDEADKIIKRYRGEEKKRSRFNVLWSNTEILRGAIYNSRPNPDVRRRFRDADPIGKAVSEILQRCLQINVDGYEFDCSMRNDVLDALLSGRGVTRIRYVASIAQTGGEQAEKQETDASREASDTDEGGRKAESSDSPDTNEGEEGVSEELEYERVEFEHVDWRDYREGYARTWAEVPWIAFRCKLTADEAGKMFGAELLKEVRFSEPDANKSSDPEQSETEKLAEFWEVWDRAGMRVFFTQEKVDQLLYPKANPDGKPPLDLVDFFPIPDPLRMVENTSSRIPVPHFMLYKEQADELDRLSGRITKIVDACRVRGIYDSKIPEMADILDSGDNQLTPVQNAQQWANAGGLESAMAFVPVEPIAKVLTQLYAARESCKQTIDEITGISDIIRGNTAASETATAQQIKANYASVRLQKMQKEVQRYCRDLLRLAAEVTAEKFGRDTLSSMTELQLPTEEQKQQLLMQAKQSGQQPDPNLQKVPTWEQVMEVMHNDAIRHFKVDVETDSTVAGTLESDMQGLSQVITAVTDGLSRMAPLVQAGMLPIDGAKEIVLSVARRARMGLAVEDAFDKLQAPAPPQQPAEPPDTAPQVAQMKAQSDAQLQQMKQQHEAQLKQLELQQEQQLEAAKQQSESERRQLELNYQQQIETLKLANQREIADANNQTALMIAQMNNEHAAEMEASRAQNQAMEGDKERAARSQEAEANRAAKETKEAPETPTAASYSDEERAVLPEIRELLASLAKPRQVIRDDGGRIVGLH